MGFKGSFNRNYLRMKKLLLFVCVSGLVLGSCQIRKNENTTSMENPVFK
jgi:muramoyltetrapeptide carboxypeptidase LdcA involved in peptidoglycan recycling